MGLFLSTTAHPNQDVLCNATADFGANVMKSRQYGQDERVQLKLIETIKDKHKGTYELNKNLIKVVYHKMKDKPEVEIVDKELAISKFRKDVLDECHYQLEIRGLR